MPLYKRKPFSLGDPPEVLEPNELVFQIRFTKEVFKDYQEYLKRLNLYRQRVWTCKVTGKINLTYEEALVSEQRATEKVQQFPTELMAPALCTIQYSTLGLKDLVSEIYTKLQEHLITGMELYGRKEQSICACKILEVVQDGDTIQYKVSWIGNDKKLTGTSIVNTEDLIRKKPPISRNILKAFIRESTSRSAPWVVREKLAKKHGVPTEPPEEMRDKLTVQNGYKARKKTGMKDDMDAQSLKVNKKRKEMESGNGKLQGADPIKKKVKKEDDKQEEEPVKYPIDDLLVKHAADDPIFTDRPSLSTDFSVPMDCVGDLLTVWNFCSSFSRLLNLWHFPLEDFENAICHKDSNLVLIAELHSAIFRLLIKDEGDYSVAIGRKKQKSKIKLTNWTEYLCEFLEMEGRRELSVNVSTIKRGFYGFLDIHVKLAILRELVAEALITDAIRDKLDDCLEQQQALSTTKREEGRKKKEDKHPKEEESESKDMNQGNILENGKGHMHDSNGTEMVYSSKRNHTPHNGEGKHNIVKSREAALNPMENRGSSEKGKNTPGVKEIIKGRQRGKDKQKETLHSKNEEERKEHLEREIEKFAIRVNSLGKDRNYNRYWFFRREGRLFVESSDSKQWGYYAAKEELDALMGSLNPKGERERALQRQLEKSYHRISAALQKRTKDITNNILLEEAELRRSSRVRVQPRDRPAMSFLKYVNKWKEN